MTPTGSRPVARLVEARSTVDGAGVLLGRSLGSRALPDADPFLLLDEFHSDRPEDYLAGFPWHPHRGIETVTVLLEGTVAHGDSLGNAGVIGPGDLQWMTAGDGILHQEMPRGDAEGRLWGLQLWVSLPRALKRCLPRYQDIDATSVPTIVLDEGAGSARLYAGTLARIRSPVSGVAAEPLLVLVRVEAGRTVRIPVPPDHTVLLYTLEGRGGLGPEPRTRIGPSTLAVLGGGTSVEAVADLGAPFRFLLAAGRPIGDPIVRAGPFAMNTQAEIEEAFADWRAGRIGRRPA